MKKVFLLTITALLSMTAFLSCKKTEDGKIKEPSISIELKSTTSNSITFVLKPENAVTFSYACVKSDEENLAELTTVESSTEQEFTIQDLEGNTEYVIIATATNAAGKTSPRIKETAVTTASASVKIVVRETMSKAINVVFSPVNASSFEYFCAKKAESDSAEYKKVEDGQTTEILVKNLEPDTEYVISARAYNKEGEQGETATTEIRTTKLPEINIEKLTSDAKSVTVEISCTDTDSVYYHAGIKEPSINDFKSIKVYNGKATLSVFDLEPETKYTFYIFGKDKFGYENEITSKDFETAAKGDLGLDVLKVGSRDARFDIFFNNELYSKVYCIGGSQSEIPSTENFNWDSYLSYATEITEDSEVALSEIGPYSVDCNTVYRVGIIAEDSEGNLIKDKQIWKEITTEGAVFGKTDATVNINIDYIKSTSIKYTIESQGAQSYISQVVLKSKINDLEKFAETVSDYTLSKKFDVAIDHTNLIPETEYSLIIIPVNQYGEFGEIVNKEFTTTKIEQNGIAEFEFERMTVGLKNANYNFTFDENTREVRYLILEKNSSMTEDEIINELVCGKNKKTIYNSGKIYISLSAENTEYKMCFMPLDKNGDFGKVIYDNFKTKDYTIDGNAKVEVTRLIPTVEYPYAYLNYKIEKRENCKGFYRMWIMEEYFKDKSDEELMKTVVTGQYYFNEDYEKEKESIFLNCYLVIVPVDNQDRLSPLVKIKIEGSFVDK